MLHAWCSCSVHVMYMSHVCILHLCTCCMHGVHVQCMLQAQIALSYNMHLTCICYVHVTCIQNVLNPCMLHETCMYMSMQPAANMHYKDHMFCLFYACNMHVTCASFGIGYTFSSFLALLHIISEASNVTTTFVLTLLIIILSFVDWR